MDIPNIRQALKRLDRDRDRINKMCSDGLGEEVGRDATPPKSDYKYNSNPTRKSNQI